MIMSITIEEVSKIYEGIWKSNINPVELQTIGLCTKFYGDYNIILINKPYVYDKDKHYLNFSLTSMNILNIGNSNETIIIDAEINNSFKKKILDDTKKVNMETVFYKGDKLFLQTLDSFVKLPPDIKYIGKSILIEVRKFYKGELKYYENSKKYIEFPDNFWTIKIQQVDRSLRITARGDANFLRDKVNSIEINADIHGFLSFKISEKSQINDALKIIKGGLKKNDTP